MKPRVKLYRFTARNGDTTTVSGESKADAKRAIGGSYIKIDVVGYVDLAGQWVYSQEVSP